MSGDVVIEEGAPGETLLVILSGELEITKRDGQNEIVLASRKAGEFLGEMAMFTQSLRSADVVAETPTRLLRFTAEAFRQLIKDNPAAAAPMLFAIARTMANRILADNQRFQQEVASGFVWR